MDCKRILKSSPGYMHNGNVLSDDGDAESDSEM